MGQQEQREGAEGGKPPGARSTTRRKAGEPRARGDEPAAAPASVRMYVRIPRELHRRWETWCAWHQANPSELIALFLEAKTRGFVVQQRPTGPAEEPGPASLPMDERKAG